MNEKTPISIGKNIAESGNTGMVPSRVGDLVDSAGYCSHTEIFCDGKCGAFNQSDKS
jgi:hypothetical protein